MSSFYEKLSMKFQGEDAPPETGGVPTSVKSVTFSATGERTATVKKMDVSEIPPETEKAPEGTDPIDVDLFQSDSRMVIFMQVSGIPADKLEITISEESNTLIIEAAQKRPDLPPAQDIKEGAPAEKGIYAKREIKWRSLYRKIYLPAAFDGSDATAVLESGVLVITLPAKHPGVGKKLTVREVRQDEHEK